MSIDLKSMSRKELERLQTRIGKALDRLTAREKKQARDAAEKAAKEFGFSLDELNGGKKPRKTTRKATKAKAAGKPKYANPADPSQTWTGKGRQPQWFKDAVASGVEPGAMQI